MKATVATHELADGDLVAAHEEDEDARGDGCACRYGLRAPYRMDLRLVARAFCPCILCGQYARTTITHELAWCLVHVAWIDLAAFASVSWYSTSDIGSCGRAQMTTS